MPVIKTTITPQSTDAKDNSDAHAASSDPSAASTPANLKTTFGVPESA